MGKARRGGDDLTRNSRKNRRASKNKSLVSGHFLQDDRSQLTDGLKSYLSKSVANITLYNGDTILFSYSGIAIKRRGRYLTRFLTSSSLARALDCTNEDHGDLKIDVRHEGNEVYMGVMAEFDLDRNFAVVNVHGSLDVRPFQHALEILPRGVMLVAIGRAVSGEMMAKSVVLDDDSRVSQDDQDLDCKISEAWEGGPLLSVVGEVVGMNFIFTMRRAVFLPWGTVLKHLEYYCTSVQKKTGLAQSKMLKVYRFGARPIGEKSNSHPEGFQVLALVHQLLDSSRKKARKVLSPVRWSTPRRRRRTERLPLSPCRRCAFLSSSSPGAQASFSSSSTLPSVSSVLLSPPSSGGCTVLKSGPFAVVSIITAGATACAVAAYVYLQQQADEMPPMDQYAARRRDGTAAHQSPPLLSAASSGAPLRCRPSSPSCPL
ncbi:LOW QUALITY PROTEIN: hypothetical protein U9M48_029904 [Paspalum notatum var. saurae]|uniref:Uncharacterized protein n=1 Tax=Paspalum notatum var. saurae TaxID=547442 RepID=A0AAQ3TZE7_PASNO